MSTPSFSDLDKYYQDMMRVGAGFDMYFMLQRNMILENMSDTFLTYKFQANGVAVVLNPDGTWFFEDTSGG